MRLVPAVLVGALLSALVGVGPASSDPVAAPGGGKWPLRPRPDVVARFQAPATRWGAGHRGVDLLGRPGQAVHSSLAGRVAFAGTLAGRGVVVVDHGARRTTYEPVEARVSLGEQVAAGAVLGRLQSGGSHCFPRTCLHWGLIVSGPGGTPGTSDGSGDHYVDPLTLVGAGPVRLYPLSGPVTGTSPLAAWLVARSLVAARPGLAATPPSPVETSLVAP
jgi:murein DD-endopeptidase MepM/ murein hydrolase activator NlpD